jgi:hypothetical protein
MTVVTALCPGGLVPEGDVDHVFGLAACPECFTQQPATPCSEDDGRDWWIDRHEPAGERTR